MSHLELIIIHATSTRETEKPLKHMLCRTCTYLVCLFFPGPFNLSGEWSGVVGDVVTGKYPMSFSTFYWTLERDRVVDCSVVIGWGNMISNVVLQTPQIDTGKVIDLLGLP